MSLISDYFNNWLKWPVFVRLIITFAVPPIIPLLIIYYLKYYRYLGSLKKLKGKVVLITGASSGFGEALAHSFYKAGCRVILSARRENELERVRDTLLQMYQVLKYTFVNTCLFVHIIFCTQFYDYRHLLHILQWYCLWM